MCYMYVLYVCIICMYYMYVFYVYIICIYYVYVKLRDQVALGAQKSIEHVTCKSKVACNFSKRSL